MRSLSNFGCKIVFMCSVNFWHQQDSNASFKGSIGHVTSQCNWPITYWSGFGIFKQNWENPVTEGTVL